MNDVEITNIYYTGEIYEPAEKIFFLAAFFIFCLSLTNALAQTPTSRQSEPSFDVILQTVVAANDGGKSDVAPSLSGIIKKLKTDLV